MTEYPLSIRERIRLILVDLTADRGAVKPGAVYADYIDLFGWMNKSTFYWYLYEMRDKGIVKSKKHCRYYAKPSYHYEI